MENTVYLTIKDLAGRWGMNRDYVRDILINTRHILPVFQPCPGQAIRIKLSDIEDYEDRMTSEVHNNSLTSTAGKVGLEGAASVSSGGIARQR